MNASNDVFPLIECGHLKRVHFVVGDLNAFCEEYGVKCIISQALLYKNKYSSLEVCLLYTQFGAMKSCYSEGRQHTVCSNLHF